jgi:hypothetical protein
MQIYSPQYFTKIYKYVFLCLKVTELLYSIVFSNPINTLSTHLLFSRFEEEHGKGFRHMGTTVEYWYRNRLLKRQRFPEHGKNGSSTRWITRTLRKH